MVKQVTTQDRNFDDLAKRFTKNIYGGLKGDIRLAVLNRDCARHLAIAPFGNNTMPQRILDAGGGQGQFSLQFAQAGHNLVICDISIEMLKLAEAQVIALGLEKQVTLVHCAFQDIAQHLSDSQFDFIICHAVMEWLQDPHLLLPCLLNYLKPDGHLSLTFYNLHSLIYKNLLRTNFKKVINKDYGGSRGSLTPINPLDPQQVLAWTENLRLKVLSRSGIRVFHDYIFNEEHREREPDVLLEMELQFSQLDPYRSLGRYVHLLMQKGDE